MLIGEDYTALEQIMHSVFQILNECEGFKRWHDEFRDNNKFQDCPYYRIEEKMKEILERMD